MRYVGQRNNTREDFFLLGLKRTIADLQLNFQQDFFIIF